MGHQTSFSQENRATIITKLGSGESEHMTQKLIFIC